MLSLMIPVGVYGEADEVQSTSNSMALEHHRVVGRVVYALVGLVGINGSGVDFGGKACQCYRSVE
jgi:hypothetical protein